MKGKKECRICEKAFPSKAALNYHMSRHFGVKSFQCTHCVDAFHDPQGLLRHRKYKHTLEKAFKCPECGCCFVERSKLNRHMTCHTGERPYQCSHCTYAAPDTFRLKRHMRVHTGEKPYQCDICYRTFTQSNTLKAHKFLHTGNGPVFKCESCPQTCVSKKDLRNHVQRLHVSDVPYYCNRCGKMLPDRYHYKQHIQTHKATKDFKCQLCSASYLFRSQLKTHMLIHKNERPFPCSECTQSFKREHLLKAHKNQHHNLDHVSPASKKKMHHCPHCERKFCYKGNLTKHLMVHDDATDTEDDDGVEEPNL